MVLPILEVGVTVYVVVTVYGTVHGFLVILSVSTEIESSVLYE
ncbi:hypothetical protein SLEP1_g56128 [Rubroshorea leprosula]|uniref:Uncharacterized protein n=1 Tax=Rubroshorea leprosula TaxID=152421 RepID=A0AAV5MK35_9ROSI|nr:hypothetical protein SLEP1_g56128 [Rubroshorea leprosula]